MCNTVNVLFDSFDSFDSFDFDDHHHNMFDSDLARQSSEIRMDYSL